jgi:predicted AAA+ superfamily ATPase
VLFRKIETLIEEHLKSDTKKILLIDGARQVGKTYIIRYVGQKLFENFIELNMVEDSLGERLFAEVKTVDDFYLQVSMLAGNKMKQEENTLIFIDEIQAYPHLLTLLKFLSQDGKFTFIASGSLLGVTLSQTTSIPMGSGCFRWILKNSSMQTDLMNLPYRQCVKSLSVKNHLMSLHTIK